ncbi:MAG: hypothetical protein ACRDWW_08070 [Acidimicrobiales bacterium]
MRPLTWRRLYPAPLEGEAVVVEAKGLDEWTALAGQLLSSLRAGDPQLQTVT